jgi:adenine phosphoribosyltransferase
MKIINCKIKSKLCLRTEKDFPKKGIEFIDINPLILQKNVLNEITNLFVDELKDKKIDYIVAPEARGFLFGSIIANMLNVGLIPVRKKGKLAPSTVECQFDYVKEYGKDSLELPKLVNDDYNGKKFYIIDDIYATGNTMKVIKEAIEKLGGEVIGEGAVLNIIELNDNKSLFSLIDVNEE